MQPSLPEHIVDGYDVLLPEHIVDGYDVLLPEHIVDGYDVLFLYVLDVTHDRGTRLDPDPASVGQHQAVVVSQHLALQKHCNTQTNVHDMCVCGSV